MAHTVLENIPYKGSDESETAGSHHKPRGPIALLAVLCLMYLVLYIDRVNIATLAPQMMKELRLSNTQFGLAVSAFSFPYALFQLVGGWTSDRLGAKQTLIACGIIICIATISTGAVTGLFALIFVRLLLGIGEGAAFPAASRVLLARVTPARWGFAQGVTHGSARLGNALAPMVVVALLAYSSWRGSFVLLGIGSLAWIALLLVVFRSPEKDVRKRSAAEPSGIAVANVNSVPWLRLARRMAPVTAVDFCYGWTLWVFLTWLPSFFLKNYGLNLKNSAIFTSGVLLGGVLGDAMGGLLSDFILRRSRSLRAARSYLIAFGLLGAFVSLMPILFLHQLQSVALCLCAACFFSELVVGPIWAVPMDIAPRYAGTASGMMNFGFGLAGIVSPIVFGKLLDLTGSWTIPFSASISLLFVGAILTMFMRPDSPFR